MSYCIDYHTEPREKKIDAIIPAIHQDQATVDIKKINQFYNPVLPRNI